MSEFWHLAGKQLEYTQVKRDQKYTNRSPLVRGWIGRRSHSSHHKSQLRGMKPESFWHWFGWTQFEPSVSSPLPPQHRCQDVLRVCWVVPFSHWQKDTVSNGPLSGTSQWSASRSWCGWQVNFLLLQILWAGPKTRKGDYWSTKRMRVEGRLKQLSRAICWHCWP